VARGKHIPVRSCTACGQRLPKRELIRIVRTLEGNVEVDLTGKKPGRGAYLCPREECWKQGLRKSRLDHVLRSPLTEQDKQALLGYYQMYVEAQEAGQGVTPSPLSHPLTKSLEMYNES